MRTLTARRVRNARRRIQRHPHGPCPARWGIRHRWAFDGYFWHRCINCGEVN